MKTLFGERMKRLSIIQANRCENASEKKCRCRCGGVLHGAKRGDVRRLGIKDLHSVKHLCHKCNGLGEIGFPQNIPQVCTTCNGAGILIPGNWKAVDKGEQLLRQLEHSMHLRRARKEVSLI